MAHSRFRKPQNVHMYQRIVRRPGQAGCPSRRFLAGRVIPVVLSLTTSEGCRFHLLRRASGGTFRVACWAGRKDFVFLACPRQGVGIIFP